MSVIDIVEESIKSQHKLLERQEAGQKFADYKKTWLLMKPAKKKRKIPEDARLESGVVQCYSLRPLLMFLQKSVYG